MKKLILLSLLLVLIIPVVIAEDQVVINSKNWQDVYSGQLYASLNDLEVHYVAEETQGLQLVNEVLPRDKKGVLLIESDKEPFTFGYKAKLEGVGFEVEEFISTDAKKTNLELAKLTLEKQSVSGFIILDGSLGYSALSVAPYAILTKSLVLFVDRNNIDEVYQFLQENTRDILIYGSVDRTVKDRLAPFSPEIINNGDRYKDNLEMVRKFLDLKDSKQVTFTNGEFIEPGLFNSEFPSMFIGTSNVPDFIIDFIKETDVKAGVVIGYDLFQNAKKIREQTGIKILLKYGQGRNSQLYALDVFPIPSFQPSVDIKEVRYNALTKQLEVVYENTGEVFSYVQALSIDLLVNDESVAQVGDEEAFFLQAKDISTVTYEVDLSRYVDDEETIFADSKIILGDTPGSLVKLITKKMEVAVISVEDNSEIEIAGLVYNKGTQRFEITIKNIGKEDVYANLELIDLMIAGEKVSLGAEQQKIKPGSSGLFKIKATLEEVDFEDNPQVTVHARYGAREDALIKHLTQEMKLVVKSRDYKPILVVVMVLVIVWLLVSLFKKKKREAAHHHHHQW
ncbi:MAG: hypothetical protein KKA62_04605 [Nanoarchaeota archaeon]|nr:hypothetical protein [Nanoarchaeota archaeon]MBU1643887.1 hypothetical protein [Nanoarchaeota archaeon]MBU1977202.1 hypothetical protein [Nanoarchaeota archaeon]